MASAFDYQSGSWSPLTVTSGSGTSGSGTSGSGTSGSGDLAAEVDNPGPYIGPGGVVEIRLSAVGGGIEVSGAVPTLSALSGSVGR